MLTDLPAADVLKLADAARASGACILNVAAPDLSLRGADCRANLINVAPSRDMLADALAQYLVWKKWTRWLLLVGSHPEDKLLADAYRRAAKRFGARIVQERVSKDTGGSRETDSGVVQMQQRVPVLTQGAPDYDVLIAADENEVFAGYLPYRTWDPRPVAGSAGLEPVSWAPSSESWGGDAIAEPLRPPVPSRNDAARHAGLDGGAHGRARRPAAPAAVDFPALLAYMKGPDIRRRRLQGTAP